MPGSPPERSGTITTSGCSPSRPATARGIAATARDVIDLIRIRALANAGVPLNRVGELLTADREQLAAAVTEIDQHLQAEIRRLEEHRATVAQLATIDGLALPDEVVAYLDDLRELGIGERMVAIERDGWVIVSAQMPDEVVGWIAEKRELFEDPKVVAAYRGFEAAFDWDPGDPRLVDLADQLHGLFAQTFAERGGNIPDEIDDTTGAMLDAESIGLSPAWRRLGELLEQRGWSGWTNAESSRRGDRTPARSRE